MCELAAFDKEYIRGRSFLVGVDEAGRGALAGPVVAAAMAVSDKLYADAGILKSLEKLDDSKKLDETCREKLFEIFKNLKKNSWLDFEAASADVNEIEKLNIVGATKLAMARALEKLNARMSLNLSASGAPASLFGEGGRDLSKADVIIDGLALKKFPYRHFNVIKGDGKSLAIAGASIVAKVTRDMMMKEFAAAHPRYGFEIHKGYGTPVHSQNILIYGACEIHRPSFLKKLRDETIPETQGELF